MNGKHTIAISNPPPRANPSIAATNGFRPSSISTNIRLAWLISARRSSTIVEQSIIVIVDQKYLGKLSYRSRVAVLR